MKKRQESVLIVMLAGIGDLVMASQSFRAIRNGYPSAEIYLLTNAQAAALAEKYSYIDHVIPFPVRDMRKNFAEAIRVVLKLRRARFEVCVNLFRIFSTMGAVKMGLLFFCVRAKKKVGHDHKGFGLFLTHKVPGDHYLNKHNADAMLEVAALAGGAPDGRGVEAFWGESNEKKLAHLFANKGDGWDIAIGVNPGGNRLNKRLPPEKFASVLNSLAARFKIRIFILGGPGEESIANEISKRIASAGVTELCGKLDIGDLPYITSRLDLLLTNDSGPMHIASATGTPIVAVFGPDDPFRTGPYMPKEKFKIIKTDLDCQPCVNDGCDHVTCLHKIDESDIFNAAVSLIETNSEKRGMI